MFCDEGFNIAKNLKYGGYHCRLASMVYKCFGGAITRAGKSAIKK